MLTVCNYHYIRSNFKSSYSSIFGITPLHFKKQIKALGKMGTFVTPDEFSENSLEILNSKTNYLLVTFDDGLKEQFELARPILQEINCKGLYFVNSINFIEKQISLVHKIHLIRSVISSTQLINLLNVDFHKYFNKSERQKAKSIYIYDTMETASLKYVLNFKLTLKEREHFITPLFKECFNEQEILNTLYMNKEQLKILDEEKSLGSHGHSHVSLGVLQKADMKKELELSKKYLEEISDNKINYVSYPYGDPSSCKGADTVAAEIGYKIGFTTTRGINSGDDKMLLLKRFDANDLPLGKNADVFKNYYN